MIRAQEKGRRLHITVGDDEASEAFVIDPVDVETGATLLADFLGIYLGLHEDPATLLESTTELARSALGTENYERAQALRASEFRDVTHAAFFWQTQGGEEALAAYLDGGLPKATQVAFAAAGVQLKPLSTTSQSSESESPTL